LTAFNQYKYKCDPEEGRDSGGRWIVFRNVQDLEENGKIDF